jgi:hypothetical protein
MSSERRAQRFFSGKLSKKNPRLKNSAGRGDQTYQEDSMLVGDMPSGMFELSRGLKRELK